MTSLRRQPSRACARVRALPRAQQGMMLLGVLVALTVVTLVTASAGMSMADATRRANEEELLFVGEQYRQAIDSYWRNSPTGVRQWPTKLEDLVEDKRFPQPRRHLRKLFRDPMAPKQDWGTVNLGLAIVGVYSRADGQPFRKVGFDESQSKFADARRYADWEFSAAAALPSGPGLGNLPGQGPGNKVPGANIPGNQVPANNGTGGMSPPGSSGFRIDLPGVPTGPRQPGVRPAPRIQP